MKMTYIIIGAVVFIVLFIIIIVRVLKSKKNKYYKNTFDDLEYQKNIVSSIPISLELSKVEDLSKNEDLQKKCEEFNDRLNKIKNEMLPHIDDMLIELDTFYDKKDYETCDMKINKTEFEIYRVREYANTLLKEITEITSSDEKYRSMITKLKTRYRKLTSDFNKHKKLYEETIDAISLKFESIEKRFMEFEKVMESNNYNDAMHIVRGLTSMIDEMSVVIKDVPDLILMCRQILPSKAKDVEEQYNQMIKEGYVLDYLNIPYNLKEIKKNTENVYDRIKVLNMNDCKLEVDTMLKYLDSTFMDFEKERLNRTAFEDANRDFALKLSKTNNAIGSVFTSLDNIKNTYNLKDDDVALIRSENKEMTTINDNYNKLKGKLENKAAPYSEMHLELEKLSEELKNVTLKLDDSLKSLGTMYDDEQRAREQLEEIEKFLKSSKNLMHNYKLPVISDKYFVELNEANEAISEVIKELSNKPITISTLNTRVDTARDLVLKLFNTTSSIIKDAGFSEKLIIYLNRFSDLGNNELIIEDATNLFNKGNYKKSLDTSLSLLKKINLDSYNYVLDLYKKD